jgi:hypothetical protein
MWQRTHSTKKGSESPMAKFNKKIARECLGPWLKTLESRYSDDKLRELVSRQNQSPGNPSLFLSDFRKLSETDLIVIVIIGWCTYNKALKTEILTELPDRIASNRTLTLTEKGLLMRTLNDTVALGKAFHCSWKEYFYRLCPLRKLLGLLSSKQVATKLDHTMRPKLVTPRKPTKGNRIRGYRDHGTCRPSHKWLAKETLSPSMAWNRTLEADFERKMLFETYLTNPWNCCGFCCIRDEYSKEMYLKWKDRLDELKELQDQEERRILYGY